MVSLLSYPKFYLNKKGFKKVTKVYLLALILCLIETQERGKTQLEIPHIY